MTPPPTTFAALSACVLAQPPRLGRTRLVCVDGPAGSGKTTFAGRLAAVLGPAAALVHLEDLYAGWTLTGSAARLSAGVLGPLAEGSPGAYRRYDWDAARFVPEPTPVPPVEVLVVEGCGAGRRELDRWTTLRVWVEAPEELRLARGLARDGEALAPQWLRWLETESALFTAESTRDRADLLVDGTAPGSPDGFALL